MFSFFRSTTKKPSTVESPETSDAPPVASVGGAGDDFIMIGNRQPLPNSYEHSSTVGGVYPSLGPGGSFAATNSRLDRQNSEVFSYLQGIPFQLSPSIRRDNEDPTEVWRIEVDQILANMTRAVDLAAER